jgi:hypothetical protein
MPFLLSRYKGDAAKLIRDCFGSRAGLPKALQSYMSEVYKLSYDARPQYSALRKIFEDLLGGRDPRKTLEWMQKAKPTKPVKPVKVHVRSAVVFLLAQRNYHNVFSV